VGADNRSGSAFELCTLLVHREYMFTFNFTIASNAIACVAIAKVCVKADELAIGPVMRDRYIRQNGKALHY